MAAAPAQDNRKKVSQTDQDALGCRAQRAECRTLAGANGDKIIREFAEQFTGLVRRTLNLIVFLTG